MKSIETNAWDRQSLLLDSCRQLMQGTITRGALLKQLRKSILGMNQTEFSELTNVSRRTLTDIESDKDGLNEDSVNAAFAIFGLQLGLVPISLNHTKQLLEVNKP